MVGRFKTIPIVFAVVGMTGIGCTSSKNNTVSEAASGINSLSKQEQKEGWILLFDGKSTNGWHTYNRDTVSSNWKVVTGILLMDPKAKSSRSMEDLVTDREFEDYELALEWRISEGGNSGIIFNVQEDPKFSNTYNTGLEMQILDNIKASDNKKENHLAGLLYDMHGTASISKPKSVGAWNVARIIQKDGHLTFYFNGVKTLDVQQGSEEWKNMITNSKFKTWSDFAKMPKGKIALQDHGYEVAFRNIKIKEL